MKIKATATIMQNIFPHTGVSTLVHFHSKMRILFDALSPIVRAKTPINADESDSTLYFTLFSSQFPKSFAFVSVFGRLSVAFK